MLYFQFPFTREHFEFKVYSRNMKRCQMYLSLQYGPMHKYNASLVFVFAIWPQSSEQCILDWCEDNSQVLHLFCVLTPLVSHQWSHTPPIPMCIQWKTLQWGRFWVVYLQCTLVWPQTSRVHCSTILECCICSVASYLSYRRCLGGSFRLLFTAQCTAMSCFSHCAQALERCSAMSWGLSGDFLVVATHVRYYQRATVQYAATLLHWWHTCAIRGEHQLSAPHQRPDIEATILPGDITSSSNGNLKNIGKFLKENLRPENLFGFTEKVIWDLSIISTGNSFYLETCNHQYISLAFGEKGI